MTSARDAREGQSVRRGEHVAELRLADLHAMEFLVNAAVGVTDEGEGARLVVTGLPSIVGCDFAGIALEDESDDGWRLVVHRVVGEFDPDFLADVTEVLPALRDAAIQTGRLILPTDTSSLPPVFPAHGIDSLAVFPIRTAKGCLGVLLVGQTRGRDDGERGLDDPLLVSLVGPLALGIDNLRLRAGLETTVARRTEQLSERADQLDRANHEIQRLLDLTNAIVGTRGRAELFDAISAELEGFVPYDRSALLLYREDLDVLEVYALSGPLANRRPAVGTAIPRGEMSAAWLPIETGDPHIFDDLRAGPTSEFDRQLAADGVRSLLSVPLVVDDRTLGVLGVSSQSTGLYSQADADRLVRVGAQIAIALEKMRAFEEIERLTAQLERENLYLKEELRTAHDFEEIVGESSALLGVLRAVETVAPTDASVLITGETGTGKELIARAIHDRSKRSSRALVKINCAAIPEGLVESELFGHEKGAFTGALNRRMGRFQLADHGTIFLDEIGELPLGLQTKLLRVLQEGEFERLGSAETRTVDVRVIAATNRDLNAEMAAGTFRSDLYYRLNVFPIEVPPLRARDQDVQLLVGHFTDKFSRKFDRSVASVPRAAMDRLASYDWPGNVRELRNVVERAVILSTGESLDLGSWFEAPASDAASSGALSLDEVQRDHILRMLERTSWKVSGPGGAAELLGLKPTTLEHRMKKLEIERPDR